MFLLLNVGESHETLCNLCVVVCAIEELCSLSECIYRHWKSCVCIACPADTCLVVDDVGKGYRDRIVSTIEETLFITVSS